MNNNIFSSSNYTHINSAPTRPTVGNNIAAIWKAHFENIYNFIINDSINLFFTCASHCTAVSHVVAVHNIINAAKK